MAKVQGNQKKLSTKDKLADNDKNKFIGSIPINSYVKVKLDNELIICKIIEIQNDPERKKDEVPNEYSYEYYIHYVGFNRRNDHWVKRKEIIESKVSDTEIKKLNNNNNTFNNGITIEHDENEGMHKPAVLAHEEATKVRTVEEIVMGNYRCYTWYFISFS